MTTRWGCPKFGVHSQPRAVLERSGALERIGRENVLGSYAEACERAWEVAAADGVTRDETI